MGGGIDPPMGGYWLGGGSNHRLRGVNPPIGRDLYKSLGKCFGIHKSVTSILAILSPNPNLTWPNPSPNLALTLLLTANP